MALPRKQTLYALLILTLVTGLLLAYLRWRTAQMERDALLPISLRAITTADYSADAYNTPLPAIRLDIVSEIIRDSDAEEPEQIARLATASSALLTPVPTATPQNGQVWVPTKTAPVTRTANPTSRPAASATSILLFPTPTQSSGPFSTATATPGRMGVTQTATPQNTKTTAPTSKPYDPTQPPLPTSQPVHTEPPPPTSQPPPPVDTPKPTSAPTKTERPPEPTPVPTDAGPPPEPTSAPTKAAPTPVPTKPPEEKPTPVVTAPPYPSP